jgi:hypothetical protein
VICDLSTLGLTPAQKAARRRYIGGSDANIIMSGDEEKLLRLWRVKRGEDESEDLSDVLQVQLGTWTEPFNRAWYERRFSCVLERAGVQLADLDHPYRAVTLDGLRRLPEGSWRVVEFKHVMQFWKRDDVLAKYMPQAHHSMLVAGCETCDLSVLFGNTSHEVFTIGFDADYGAALAEAEDLFWDCVQSGRPPVAVQVDQPAIPVDQMRVVDMTGNNAWASWGAAWLANRKAAKEFETGAKMLKELVEADVREAYGYGVKATRAKNGAITIREI